MGIARPQADHARRTDADESPGAPAGCNFVDGLLAAAEAPDLRRADRTRLKLLASMAKQLSEGVEHSDLKVAKVAAAAGVAHGTFYLYFPDMRAAVEVLISDFGIFLFEQLAQARSGTIGSRERIRGAMFIYARAFRVNAGLMRCLVSVGRDSTVFRKTYQRLSEGWNKRVAASIARQRQGRFPSQNALYEALLPTAYALGGMVDDFLIQLYLRQDPQLAALAGNDEAIADLLTDVWCHGAHGPRSADISQESPK